MSNLNEETITLAQSTPDYTKNDEEYGSTDDELDNSSSSEDDSNKDNSNKLQNKESNNEDLDSNEEEDGKNKYKSKTYPRTQKKSKSKKGESKIKPKERKKKKKRKRSPKDQEETKFQDKMLKKKRNANYGLKKYIKHLLELEFNNFVENSEENEKSEKTKRIIKETALFIFEKINEIVRELCDTNEHLNDKRIITTSVFKKMLPFLEDFKINMQNSYF